MAESLTLQDPGYSGITSAQFMLYDKYNNRSDLYEYDYGSAPAVPAPTAPTDCPATAPSGFLRHTSSTYLADGVYDVPNLTSPASSTHMRTLLTGQTLSDSGGTMVSRTSYAYDEYPLTSVSTNTGRDSSYTTAVTTRGNATTKQRYTSASTSISTHDRYDAAGNVLHDQDGKGNTTDVTYDALAAFPTMVCRQPLCYSQTFDTTGTGSLTSRTDFNSVKTTLDYTEPLDRLKTAVVAQGITGSQSQTSFNYDPSNTIITVNKDRDTFQDGLVKTVKIVDGLGREKESQQFEDSGYISVQRTYL